MHSSSPASHPKDNPLEEVLNTPQIEAVTHAHGPLLVLAGAGSGKTRVITYRIAHLLATLRIPPYRILSVTFTNKAAREMRTRIDSLVGPEITSDLWVGTFHATCARLLRRYHDAVGLCRNFAIYDDSDQRAVMKRACQSLKLDERRFPPKLLLSTIHSLKQQGIEPDEFSIDSPYDAMVARAYSEYQKQLLSANAVDFDDLILHIMRLAEDASSIPGSELQQRFHHVLVDEFQDVNSIQYRLIRALVTNHHNLCVVGDDDQSIYRWRGADVRIIRGLKRDFPGTRLVKLEQNYRSSGNVVRAALAVIQPSLDREAKDLFTNNAAGNPVRVLATQDERDEADRVVDAVEHALQQGVDPRQVAIFYRVHAQSRVLEEAMRAHNLPYQIVGGTRFFDRAEIKNLIAYLRVIANPASDVDLLRIINVPARQIGATTVEHLVATANATDQSIYDVVRGDLRTTGLKPSPRKRVTAFAIMMEGLRTLASDLGPRALAERILEVTGYENSLLLENSAEADARLENLHELLGSLTEYEEEVLEMGQQPSLSDYLERISLVSDVDQMKDAPRVSMMTVHAAKGLEFELVLITGFEEDLFPYRSQNAIFDPDQFEEERRLAYVAFTRARIDLLITHTASRMIFGSRRYGQPSTFLDDLPPDVTEYESSSRHSQFHSPPPTVHPSRQSPNPVHIETRAPGERYVELDEPDSREVDETSFRPGSVVLHNRYGQGRIDSVHDSQSPPIAIVSFPGWGKKKIAVTFLHPIP